MKLPSGYGFSLHRGKIRFSYWDRFEKKTKKYNTHCPPTKQGIIQAKQIREEFLYKFKKAPRLLPDAKAILLSKGLELYKKYRARDGLSASTLYSLNYSTRIFIEAVGDKFIESYTDEDFDDFLLFLDSNGVAQNTKNSYSRSLRTMFNFFVKKGLTEHNIISPPAYKPKKPKRIPAPDLNELLNYLKEHNTEAYRTVKLLVMTGLRKTEATRLLWENINFDEGIIEVKNVKQDRIDYLPLYDDLRDFLLTFRKPSGKVIAYKGGYSFSFFRRAQIDLWGESKYTIHQLRKTFISSLVNSDFGKDLYAVKIVARHRNIKTTLDYYTEAELKRITKALNKSMKSKGK